jgi:hypothetical protein
VRMDKHRRCQGLSHRMISAHAPPEADDMEAV